MRKLTGEGQIDERGVDQREKVAGVKPMKIMTTCNVYNVTVVNVEPSSSQRDDVVKWTC